MIRITQWKKIMIAGLLLASKPYWLQAQLKINLNNNGTYHQTATGS